MNKTDYWRECIETAAEECGLLLTREQLECMAADVEGCHENYGMAFYSPPPSDRIAEVEREWKVKYEALQREFETYRNNAHTAVKKALRQRDDAVVSIGEDGEVLRYDGRCDRIQ